ncbi:MAG: BT0820 family HAD-type phosphatase [Fermentimonas sp.]|jgi:hydroxymethylpyrimidine pyrophosphatase-like HAD family hydrolase
MIIAVDFDGTIVEHEYPKIGKPIPFAIETLKQLQKEHHKLILWSVREGELLREAVDYCADRGLHFYAVNENYLGERKEKKDLSRKIDAEIFIDDRNLGGLPDWGVIYNAIKATEAKQDPLQVMAQQTTMPQPKKRRGIFGFRR